MKIYVTDLFDIFWEDLLDVKYLFFKPIRQVIMLAVNVFTTIHR